MSLLGQYIPEPPAIVELIRASDQQEAITKDKQRSAIWSKSTHEKYADDVTNGIARLLAEAHNNSIDFERAIYEITLLEQKTSLNEKAIRHSLKQAEKALVSAMPLIKPRRPSRTGKDKERRISEKLNDKRRRMSENIKDMRSSVAFLKWLLPLSQQVTVAFQDCRRALETLRDIRLAEYAPEWENYLSKLETTIPVADEVRRVWSHLKPLLWAPEASPTGDGDFIMVWDRGPHHLQVRILSSGLYDWFYRNRETNEVHFEEDLALDGQYSNLDAIVSRIT